MLEILNVALPIGLQLNCLNKAPKVQNGPMPGTTGSKMALCLGVLGLGPFIPFGIRVGHGIWFINS